MYDRFFFHALISFLTAKDVKAVKIHQQISELSAMSEGIVRKWVKALTDDNTSIGNEEQNVGLSA